MHEVLFETELVPDVPFAGYGDAGLRLADPGVALAIRHEHYTNERGHALMLFARGRDLGAQVYVHVFPADALDEWRATLSPYEQLRSDFRLPKGQTFDAGYLAPAHEGFAEHLVVRVKDGRRRRVVHGFVGSRRRVVVVWSGDGNDLLAVASLAAVCRALTLADRPLAPPFR